MRVVRGGGAEGREGDVEADDVAGAEGGAVRARAGEGDLVAGLVAEGVAVAVEAAGGVERGLAAAPAEADVGALGLGGVGTGAGGVLDGDLEVPLALADGGVEAGAAEAAVAEEAEAVCGDFDGGAAVFPADAGGGGCALDGADVDEGAGRGEAGGDVAVAEVVGGELFGGVVGGGVGDGDEDGGAGDGEAGAGEEVV